MKKLNLEVTCKQNHFGYWNWSKRLPNLVNVAALAPTSPLFQMWIKTHRCLVCMKDPQLINASSPRT